MTADRTTDFAAGTYWSAVLSDTYYTDWCSALIGETPDQGSFRGITRRNAVLIVEKLTERKGKAFPLFKNALWTTL